MPPIAYEQRREEIEHYFDRTAAQAWARLTSQEPLGHIRSSVREGRNRMRDTLLSWLPQDMRGMRLLDAGCGTGALAQEAMKRGAHVLAIDLSPTLSPKLPLTSPGAGTGQHRQTYLKIDFLYAEYLDMWHHGHLMDAMAGTHLVPPAFALPADDKPASKA